MGDFLEEQQLYVISSRGSEALVDHAQGGADVGTTLIIVKRDGSYDLYNPEKIVQAICKAYRANNVEPQESAIEHVVESVTQEIRREGRLDVERVQDLVELGLMAFNPYIARKYITYRNQRTIERDKRTQIKRVMDGIVQIEANDVNHSNANMSSHTPAGQMMTFASEVTKDYTVKHILNKRYAEAHRNGDIHIHDLDYYPTKTTTCLQYDLEDLYERGFRTKNGTVRTPQSIQSYATLATIIFQTNQNEQHGGQSIPAFDFFMAPGVRKSFWKHLARHLYLFSRMGAAQTAVEERALRNAVYGLAPSVSGGEKTLSSLLSMAEELSLSLNRTQVQLALEESILLTRRDTHQAMEGFIHNLNTMHSRGGNQVVFSSINYGTDTSPEGRMLIEELLRATEEGLGHGEVPIFPIQIFKVKEGVNFSEADYAKAYADLDAALAGEMEFDAPNFDLFLAACRTTSTALFPNFLFLDAPFNRDEFWDASDPRRYVHEVATMGCRTRVYENLHGERTSIGRGNLSFTSINFPRLAIESRRQAETMDPTASAEEIERAAADFFLTRVESMTRMVAEQLMERYEYQKTACAVQFPFMMGNDVWKGGGALAPAEQVGDVLRHGTLGIGFIGGHNAMVAIYGKGHGELPAAWHTLYRALERMNLVVAEYKQKYALNFAVLATPAEGLAGRFTRLDKKRYGVISGVNDRPYYVNSFHIDVQESIGMLRKIELEAPFHALTSGGHITYVELDGEAKKNVGVILKVVRAMRDAQIGYGSINHPVDTCKQCGYRGVIYDKCPVCQSDQIARLRRITGYLTGTLEGWNSAKQAEERDRVKHA